MGVLVHRIVLHIPSRVTVDVHMPHTHLMSVDVDMDLLANQPIQHVPAESDEHAADRDLQRQREMLRNCCAERQYHSPEQQQRERVADAPGRSVSHALRKRVMSRDECRHGGQMIRFGRVLDAEEKTDHQHAEFIHGVSSTAGGGKRS
jgi:hypothetical protein